MLTVVMADITTDTTSTTTVGAMMTEAEIPIVAAIKAMVETTITLAVTMDMVEVVMSTLEATAEKSAVTVRWHW